MRVNTDNVEDLIPNISIKVQCTPAQLGGGSGLCKGSKVSTRRNSPQGFWVSQ